MKLNKTDSLNSNNFIIWSLQKLNRINEWIKYKEKITNNKENKH